MERFRQVVRDTPLISIDLIIYSPDGAVLVGRRNNEPAKGYWFVPGGRIQKGETRSQAFSRLVRAELGIEASIESAEFSGVWEHHYETNALGDPDFGTHYVVLSYILRLSQKPQLALDDQHSDVRWALPEALRDDPTVHFNTQAYFRSDA